MRLQIQIATLTVAALTLAWLPPTSFGAASVYTGGHGDMGVEYDADEDPNGFFVHLHVAAGAIVDGASLGDSEEFLPSDAIIQVPNSSNIGRTAGVLGGSFEAYDFTGAGFDFLGTAVGKPLWVLMFDSADASYYGQPFFGMGAEEGFVAADWSGSIQFALTGFSGPGDFAAMSGAFSRRWDTQDASFANDLINIGPGGHSHFYLAFTAPGTYEVELTVTGTHKVHGAVTGSDTFTFEVVPEASSLAMVAFGSVGLAAATWRRRRRGN
ncbi:MAG: choice-of-anchor M domain-containing protein [Pirellulales bacterium]